MLLKVFLLSPMIFHAFGQEPGSGHGKLAIVDREGVMRWEDTGREICAYGVNYTLPFAHAYRAARYLETDHETAIRQDIYHLSRLGLDGFRVHVWDCEISDTLGNLIENEHLRLFDYLLKVMKDYGIRAVITPVAYWGNGYPEQDEDTPGFSTRYGKEHCLTDPGAIRAQERYLGQFVSHVNPCTGLAYKDDPDIIAFEICNEPHHGGTAEETRRFINRMVDAIRITGCRKPVFYNASHSIHLAEAYFSSRIQGGTFQWYPSGLVAGHEMKGNFLPNVTAYPIPFDTVPNYGQMARIVYEYDAADIGGSYIHPYMAKSFREAGIQFAAQFSYDPMFMAHANTEYQTHYMNLAYTPRKALSLMIAAEAFRSMPPGQKSGSYPADTLFGHFRVSYVNDLSEMVSREQFIHSNHTRSVPPHPEQLQRIAGAGSSPLVTYRGTGAYFLDRLENGVWRMEMMPDAVWVRDPFERASLSKQVSVIIHRDHPMKIALPGLGEDFSVTAINQGNELTLEAEDGSFMIRPGTYLLVRKGKITEFSGRDPWKGGMLGEFVAPPTNCNKTYLLHDPPQEITAGINLKVRVRVVSAEGPESVELFLYRGWRPERISMDKRSAFGWETEIPAEKINRGFLQYYVVVTDEEGSRTFPPDVIGRPTDWDFYQQDPYSVPVVGKDHPLVIFDAEKDAGAFYGNSWFRTSPSRSPGETVVEMRTENLHREPHTLASRFFFREKIAGRTDNLDRFSELVLQGYCTTGHPFPVELSLVMNDGTTCGGIILLEPGKETYSLKLDELERVNTINLPVAYPVFLPFYAEGNFLQPFDILRAESVQISIGPGIPETEYDRSCGLAVEKVFLK